MLQLYTFSNFTLRTGGIIFKTPPIFPKANDNLHGVVVINVLKIPTVMWAVRVN